MFLKLMMCGAGDQQAGLELQLENPTQGASWCIVAMENIDFIEPKLIGNGVWGAKIHTKRGLAFKVGESVEDIALMLGYQYGVIERKTVNEAMKPKCAVEPQKES